MEIPTAPNKRRRFDPDKYVEDTLEEEVKKWKLKYNDEHIKDLIANKKNCLEKEVKILKSFLDKHIKAFIDGQRSFNYKKYGPNVGEYGSQSEIILKAWDTFKNMILDKGYNWNENSTIENISDFMEGKCRRCTVYIEITN